MSANSLFSQPIPNNYRTVSGIVTPSQDDTVLYCDTSSGAVVINLLAIPDNYWNTNAKLYIVDNSNNSSVNNITINAGTGQTIDNQSSISIATNGGSVCVRVSGNTRYSTIGGSNTIPSLTIPVNNTVYVMKNGSDTTGLVERFDKPFLTIGAAVTAALAYFTSRSVTSRVKIVVESGNYTETITLYDFIDYDLGNSVIIAPTSTTAQCIVNASTSFTALNNGQFNCIIYGNATFIQGNDNPSALEIVGVTSADIKVLMYCSSIYAIKRCCVLMRTGYLKLYCDFMYNPSTVSDYNSSTFRPTVIALSTNSTYQAVVAPYLEVYNCKIYMNQSGSARGAINFQSGVIGNCNTNPLKLSLVNCEVGSWATETAAIFSNNIASGSNYVISVAELVLKNTLVYSSSGASISNNQTTSTVAVQTGSWIKVYNYGSYTNQAIDSATITATSGVLQATTYYTITNYVAGDDFSNVATVVSGTINTTGCVFIATSTTPTNWSNGSTLSSGFTDQYIGTILVDANVQFNNGETI